MGPRLATQPPRGETIGEPALAPLGRRRRLVPERRHRVPRPTRDGDPRRAPAPTDRVKCLAPRQARPPAGADGGSARPPGCSLQARPQPQQRKQRLQNRTRRAGHRPQGEKKTWPNSLIRHSTLSYVNLDLQFLFSDKSRPLS